MMRRENLDEWENFLAVWLDEIDSERRWEMSGQRLFAAAAALSYDRELVRFVRQGLEDHGGITGCADEHVADMMAHLLPMVCMAIAKRAMPITPPAPV